MNLLVRDYQLKIIAIIMFTFMLAGQTAAQVNTKVGAGVMSCNIDGDTVSWALTTSQTPDYFDFQGGTADKGLIRMVWEKTKSAADIKTGTVELTVYSNEKKDTYVLWADFLTLTPYVIKSGRLTVTDNSAGILKGTLELTVELGGSSMIGEILKGKKQSELKYGYFEVNY
jgi:hypothetical protein